jgi:hypothetical protein
MVPERSPRSRAALEPSGFSPGVSRGSYGSLKVGLQKQSCFVLDIREIEIIIRFNILSYKIYACF